VVTALGAAGLSCAQLLSEQPPEAIRGLDVSDRRGASVPPDLLLIDAEGSEIELGSYLTDQRPAVLLMVYYDCPKLCGLMLQTMSRVINETAPTVGEDYKIVVVSFDHANTPAMAQTHEIGYKAAYARGLTELGHASFRFHTTTAAEARRLADAIGFDYRYQPADGEFAHPSVMYVLTPDGRVSSYLSGLDYSADQLRIALLDAGKSKIGMSLGDLFLHMCFTFDPTLGRYTVQAMTVMKIAGVLSILGVGGLVAVLRLRELGARRASRARVVKGGSAEGSAGAGRTRTA
jgi:protein SCO1/2